MLLPLLPPLTAAAAAAAAALGTIPYQLPPTPTSPNINNFAVRAVFNYYADPSALPPVRAWVGWTVLEMGPECRLGLHTIHGCMWLQWT